MITDPVDVLVASVVLATLMDVPLVWERTAAFAYKFPVIPTPPVTVTVPDVVLVAAIPPPTFNVVVITSALVYNVWATPRPPAIVTAPLVVLVESVVLLTTRLVPELDTIVAAFRNEFLETDKPPVTFNAPVPRPVESVALTIVTGYRNAAVFVNVIDPAMVVPPVTKSGDAIVTDEEV